MYIFNYSINYYLFYLFKDALIYNISDHSHFVQGVAWDPLGEYIATQSSDRYVNVYSYQFKKNGAIVVTNIGKFSKMDIKTKVENNEDDKKEGQSANDKAILDQNQLKSSISSPSSILLDLFPLLCCSSLICYYYLK